MRRDQRQNNAFNELSTSLTHPARSWRAIAHASPLLVAHATDGGPVDQVSADRRITPASAGILAAADQPDSERLISRVTKVVTAMQFRSDCRTIAAAMDNIITVCEFPANQAVRAGSRTWGRRPGRPVGSSS